MKISRILAAGILFLSPVFSQGVSPKLSKDLSDVDPRALADVIVQFRNPASDDEHRNIANLGGRRKADLALIKSSVYNLPAAVLAALSKMPNVDYVSPDREVRATLDYVAPTVGSLQAFQAGLDGTGVGIAIIDSGIQESRDLLSLSGASTRIVYSQSFVPGTASVADQYGHGTHVAGIAAGNGSNSTGPAYFTTFRGIAPNATLINLRVLDAKGVGTDSAVIAAIDKAIQLKSKYNIRILNLSVGRPVRESYAKDPLCQAVEKAWKAGIVVVVAAGNEGRLQSTSGYATITSPANDPLVITVGAMKTMGSVSRSDDLIASYSSKGPTLIDHVVKPDIVAPGNRVISLAASKSQIASTSTPDSRVPYSYYQKTSSKTYSVDYLKLSGTSMAAPVVSGAAALMLDKDSRLSPDTIKARLMKTASKFFPASSTAVDPSTNVVYTSQYDLFTVGAGYIDVGAALNSREVVPQGRNASSPAAAFDTVTNSVRVISSTAATWGTSAVWGTAAIWGTAAVWGTHVFVDGQAAVWGTNTLWGTAAVWGTASLQGSAAVWGTNMLAPDTAIARENLGQLINGEN